MYMHDSVGKKKKLNTQWWSNKSKYWYSCTLMSVFEQIVDQLSLEVVEEIKTPVVFCVAAWFEKVRLIDNIEINV